MIMNDILFLTREIRNKLVCPNVIVSRLPKVPSEDLINLAQQNIRDIVQYILEIERHAI